MLEALRNDTVLSRSLIVTDNPAETLTIRLRNVAEAEDCLLLDISTGESEPIYEGMEIPVTGSTNGRYYITRVGSAAGDQHRLRPVRHHVSAHQLQLQRGKLSA